jgi:hypothetical protein
MNLERPNLPTNVEHEVNMENKREKRWKAIRGLFFLAVLLAAAVVTPYVLPVSEPAKVFLLGAALVGVAVWGRKHFKPQSHP